MARVARLLVGLSVALVTVTVAAQTRGVMRVEPGAQAVCVAAVQTTPPTEYIAVRDAGGGSVDLEIGVVGAPGSPRVVAGSEGQLIRLRVDLATGGMWCTVRARITGLSSGDHDILLEHGSQASSGVVRQHFTVR